MPDATAAKPVRGSLRTALLWASLGQGGFFVLQFGSSIILARLLDPREMGVFAVGAAAVGLVSALQGLGLNNFLIRTEVIDRATLATVFTVNLGLSVLVGAVILATGLVSAHLFREPGALRVMLWMASTPAINAIGLVPSSLLQRSGDFQTLSLLRIGSTALGNVATIALAVEGYSYMSLAYGWVLTCAATSLGACLLAPQHVQWRLGLPEWRSVTKFGLGMLVINGVTQAQRQLLNLIMGRTLGLEAVGVFARANSLSSLLFENTQTVAMRVFLVDFSETVRQGGQLGHRYRRVVDLITALLWPLFAGVAVLAGPCTQLLYGAKWNEAAVPLSLLCIAAMLWISVAMAWELFVVANETGRQSRLEVIRSIVGTLLFLVGCQYSLRIAAATRIAESLFVIVLYRPHINRITHSRFADLAPVYLRNGMLTLVAVAPAIALMVLYRWSPTTPLPFVFGSIGAGMIAWTLALMVTRHPIAAELIRIARRRTPMPAAPC